ncbi:50S ribosomal protein L7/L12 [Micromonospora sp. PLK6-60]|uniref:hypothetical protein n=1 Tax=Micromonospora sp. PLK6-60 TaxID=2873383 RepID=UPI001CA784DB|nr:hypothetical protein [Micromonospora sp. PLK6-60]MBY8870964.1 50S ribosomal protein L7/L12 [Micromonospora sp. PLK6-60]
MSPGVEVVVGVLGVVGVVLLLVFGRGSWRPRELGAPGRTAEEGQAEVLRLVRDGRTVEAVKVLRQQTGLGLLEAKRAVDLLAAGGSWPPGAAPPGNGVAGRAGVADGAGVVDGAHLDDGVRAEAARLAHGDRKIQAIKLVREHTNWTLAEAKRYVDGL